MHKKKVCSNVTTIRKKLKGRKKRGRGGKEGQCLEKALGKRKEGQGLEKQWVPRH